MSATPPKDEPSNASRAEHVGEAHDSQHAAKLAELMDFAFLEVLATQRAKLNRSRSSCS
jgi:hypothetical protein